MSETGAAIWAFLRRHPRERLLALFLAVIVWYAIREATSSEILIEDVPIEILRDEGLAVLDQSETATDVRFSGSRADLRDLTRNQVRVIVDARGRRREGPQTVAIGPGNVAGPRGTRPVFVRVDRVSFSLDREIEKIVPVKVDLQGTPPPGVEVERTISQPPAVTLRGPSSRIRDVESVRTLPIDMEGRQHSFRVRRPLVSPGAAGETRLDPDRAQVEIVLVERSVSRTVEGLAVLVLNEPGADAAATRVSPERVSVVIQGPAEALETVRPDDLQAFVDMRSVRAGEQQDLAVRVFTAAPIRIAAVNPPQVRVVRAESEEP